MREICKIINPRIIVHRFISIRHLNWDFSQIWKMMLGETFNFRLVTTIIHLFIDICGLHKTLELKYKQLLHIFDKYIGVLSRKSVIKEASCLCCIPN